MARLNSFYLPRDRWGEPFELDKGEAKHLFQVLRMRPGQMVRLFDGHGREGHFNIARAEKKRVLLEPVEIFEHPASRSSLTLALGWTKSLRRGWFLERCVELGVARVLFWMGCRSQGKLPDEVKPAWTDKLIQGAKQCGNPFLPEIGLIHGGAGELAEMAGDFHRSLVLWEGASSDMVLNREHFTNGHKILAAIGPEGGFEDQEARVMVDAGFEPVSLGRNILRFETAALACMAMAHLSFEARIKER